MRPSTRSGPILKPLDTIECRDAILAPDSAEPDWPKADVVIVADPEGVIVAGETRYKAAVLIGLTAAPVVTIPARQARAFRVIDNRTSELTSWDTDLLPDALSGLSDLDIFSFDDVLPLAVTAGKTDPDDIPETPKNPVTRTGNLWVLGKHRIVCGDSTDQKTVERRRPKCPLRPTWTRAVEPAGVGEIDDLERGGIAEPGRCSTPFADGRIVHVGKQEPVQLGHVVVDHGPGFAQEVLGLLLRQPRIHR